MAQENIAVATEEVSLHEEISAVATAEEIDPNCEEAQAELETQRNSAKIPPPAALSQALSERPGC